MNTELMDSSLGCIMPLAEAFICIAILVVMDQSWKQKRYIIADMSAMLADGSNKLQNKTLQDLAIVMSVENSLLQIKQIRRFGRVVSS